MDDSSPTITPNNASQWRHDAANVGCYTESLSYTDTAGASLSYTFNGVAIWYDYVPPQDGRFIILYRFYSSLGLSPSSASFIVSIDDSTPQRLNGLISNGEVDQQMIWSNTSLGPGRHTLKLTHDDVDGTTLSLDFFRLVISLK